MDLYLGHTAQYWLELEKKAMTLNVVDILDELANAYGKIGFYEKRIKDMHSLINK